MPLIATELPPAERVERPALLVVDMQNDFVREGAPLEVPDARATIPPVRRLLEAFRARGLPVVFTRFLSEEEDNLLWLWSPQCHPGDRACWPGHRRRFADRAEPLEGAAIVDELPPAPGELVVIDGDGGWREPAIIPTTVVHADATATAHALADALGAGERRTGGSRLRPPPARAAEAPGAGAAADASGSGRARS